jgi:hypothetical protein
MSHFRNLTGITIKVQNNAPEENAEMEVQKVNEVI